MRNPAVCFCALALLACGGDALQVENAWLRAAPDGSALGAAYMLVNNDGPATRLVAVRSDAHTMASLHETMISDGVSRMRALPSVAIPANRSVRMAPGGLHIMLMDPHRTLRVGDRFQMYLEFSDGRSLTIPVLVSRQAP